MSSVTVLIREIKALLEGGPDNLILDEAKFSSYVEELSLRACLTKEQTYFLISVIRLEEEVSSRAALILGTEKKLAMKETAMSKLLEEHEEVQEGMAIHILSLVAFFHEELTIDFQINNNEVEHFYLRERKNELKSHIQESITMVLVKRLKSRSLILRRRLLNREILHLRHSMERTNEFRRSIEARWTEAVNAGKDLCG
jgi:hypothetical protein